MKHASKHKRESSTNSRGMTNEVLPLFAALLIVTLIAVVLIQNMGNVGLATRGAVRGSTLTNWVPPAELPPIAPPAVGSEFTLQFASNLPSFDSPQNRSASDLPTLNILQLRVGEIPLATTVASAQVSIDGQPVSNNFTWDASTRVFTFPDVKQSNPELGEGPHAYSFHLQLVNNQTRVITTFDYGQTIQIDRTPPAVKSMKLSAGQKLAFTVQDPPVQGIPGAGMDYWNAAEITNMLNVGLIHVSAGSAANPDSYSLEANLPNALECTRTNADSDAELNCTYLFPHALTSSEIPVVFATDDAGNRVAQPITGDYESLYSESILANQFAAPNDLFSSQEIDEVLNLQATESVVFDLYVFHLDATTPTPEQSAAGWTLQGKVTNTRHAAENAETFWRERLNQIYPGNAADFSIGKVVAIVSEDMAIPAATQSQLTQVIRVPNNEYPTLPWNCDFQAGGVHFAEYCIQRINTCSFTGCSGLVPSSWGARRIIGSFQDDSLVNPKDPVHVPIVVTDYLSDGTGLQFSNLNVGGVAELVHGTIYINYAKHIGSVSHHFMPNNYEYTLTHELGHIFGLGHADASNNLMYGGSNAPTGVALDTAQIARVQAGLVRNEFKPLSLGEWYIMPPAPVPYFTDCGPVSNGILAPTPRTLDRYTSKMEDVEASYSGKPEETGDASIQMLQRYYCPLVYDGQQHVIQPAPEAVDPSNAQTMLAMYPGAVIKVGNRPQCDCTRDSELAGNGTEPNPTGPGKGPHTGGGWGDAGGGPKTKEPKQKTNCGAPRITGTSSGGSTGLPTCPNTACDPKPSTTGGAPTPQICRLAQGDDCPSNFDYVIMPGSSTRNCCKCQDNLTPPPVASDAPPQSAGDGFSMET